MEQLVFKKGFLTLTFGLTNLAKVLAKSKAYIFLLSLCDSGEKRPQARVVGRREFRRAAGQVPVPVRPVSGRQATGDQCGAKLRPAAHHLRAGGARRRRQAPAAPALLRLAVGGQAWPRGTLQAAVGVWF